MIEKVYFRNLDGLRFIAAVTVVLSHLETHKKSVGIPYISSRFFDHSAQLSVTFFFVLSGFLITWWFIQEAGCGMLKVDFKKFYLYRISRTWPLYFLVFFASLATAWYNGSLADSVATNRFTAYFLFLPNIADLFFGPDVYLAPAWSLAVEEFFYLLYPCLLVFIRSRNLGATLGSAAILFLILSSVFNPIIYNFFVKGNVSRFLHYIGTFMERYRLYALLMGSLTAYLVSRMRNSEKLPEWSKHTKSHIAFFIAVLLMFVFGMTFSFLTHQIFAFFCAILIFLLTISNRSYKILNNQLFVYGGRISFGIYMLHMFFVMRLVNQLRFSFTTNSFLLSTLLSWVYTLGGTMAFAALIYHFFERPLFQLIRSRYQRKILKVSSI